jgi:hypothetical protein
MSSDRPQASQEDLAEAIREIRAYHKKGIESLEELRGRGKRGDRDIDAQAERLGWNPTRLHKARQFAHREDGYSRKQLDELCRLLREHRTILGVSHVYLLVTVPWPEREEIQRECIEGKWSTAELQAEFKRRYGTRRKGGRRRQVPSDRRTLYSRSTISLSAGGAGTKRSPRRRRRPRKSRPSSPPCPRTCRSGSGP